MDEPSGRGIGPLALAVGLVALGSAASLATEFAVRGPFGAMNDIGNGAIGLAGAALAWRVRDRIPGQTGDVVLGAATIGAALTVVGSALVVSGTTGYFLAGLVSSVGFAGIGTWLVVASRGREARATWPRGLRSLGIAAGSLMALGVVTAPGIVLGLDDMAAAPGWIWVGLVSWLGTYAVYPAWALRLATLERSRERRAPDRAGGAASASPTVDSKGG